MDTEINQFMKVTTDATWPDELKQIARQTGISERIIGVWRILTQGEPLVTLFLILFLLYSALGTSRHALLVLLNLPFALVGGVVAATLFRMTLSVSAAVAFIVLLGIAVQNGVVLVAFFKQLREKGLPLAETVTEGCRLRFKPLFMTALVSFIGHLPMVYATGSGADIQKPLAVIVMGGIVTSTLLTLLVVPVLYFAIESRWGRAPGGEAVRRDFGGA